MNTVLLKKRMKEKNLDTATLAELLGFSEKYLDHVVKGYTPSKRLIKNLAEKLDCDPVKLAPDVDFAKTKKSLRRSKVSVE